MSSTENFVYGGISGIISRTLTSPFERLKILQQNEPLLYSKGNPIKSLQFVIKNEGFLSIFNGNLINCIRIFPQSAIQVGTYEISKKNLQEHNIYNFYNYFLSGSIAGLTSSFAVHPLETIRSKLSAQTHKNSYNGIYDCATKIYINDGIKGFYKGNVITLIGAVPFQGINFVTYQSLKNNGSYNSLINGSIAGFLSVSATYPFDVIKRKLQLSNELGNPLYKGSYDCIKLTISKYGIQGLYKGLLPCYLKIIPANAIFFTSLEILKKINYNK